jgi:hypothetical protein
LVELAGMVAVAIRRNPQKNGTLVTRQGLLCALNPSQIPVPLSQDAVQQLGNDKETGIIASSNKLSLELQA